MWMPSLRVVPQRAQHTTALCIHSKEPPAFGCLEARRPRFLPCDANVMHERDGKALAKASALHGALKHAAVCQLTLP